MAQDPTRISPTDYSASAYDILSKYDPAFSENVSVEGFFENLQNPEYAAKAYAILADADPELVNNLSLDEFVSNVKKKEVTDVTESVSDDGLSEPQLATYDQYEAAYQARLGSLPGFYSPDREPLPYNTPAEKAKRDSAMSAVDVRTRDIENMLREEREEEAERIGSTLEPISIPEGEVDAVIPQLRQAYGKYGIRFEEKLKYIGAGKAYLDAVKAIATGPDGKSVEVILELDDEGNVAQSEATKLDRLIRENARSVNRAGFAEKAMQVREMRSVPRISDNGERSTVKMAWGDVDGKFVAYPTLFPANPAGAESSSPEDWLELYGFAALDEAMKRNEVFYFDTEKEAKEFADGGWKDSHPTDVQFERQWKERGRNYYADMAFLDDLENKRREYRYLEELSAGSRVEEEIPLQYQQFFIDGNMVRDDINVIRDERGEELAKLESQFDYDNVLLELKESRDVALGKRFKALSDESVAMNEEAKVRQNQLQIQSINDFGVRVEDLVDVVPQTQEEYNQMLDIFNKYSQTLSSRQVAALGYEKAQTYYDQQFDKGVTQDYVEGWSQVELAWDNGWKRGEAMSKLLLIQFGYYDIIGDEEAEKGAMRQVSSIMDSMDSRRGLSMSRANTTGTTSAYFRSIVKDPLLYTASLTAESFAQLLPIWLNVIPPMAIAGAIAGSAGVPGVGTLAGGLEGAVGGAVAGGLTLGMPLSELLLEMGNATLDTGQKMGYDWSDPNSALLAMGDQKMWDAATERGLKRGVPIAAMGMFSNMMLSRAANASRLSTLGARIQSTVATGLTVEPASEALGEFLAIAATGEFTGSTANVKEITAEAIGAIGMGGTMGVAFASTGYASQNLGNKNFDLAMSLIDPKVLAEENVTNERIVSWTNKMEKLGQITAEHAEFIRRNVGYRRQANELLGRPLDAAPRRNGRVIGRLMELLEAKEHLEAPGTSGIFGRRLTQINDEIAFIAENNMLPSQQTDLSSIQTRVRRTLPPAYKFNGKNVNRAEFLSQIQEASPRQLRKARAYNDIEAQRELISRRGKDAIQKRKAAEVPVGEEPGVSPQVDQQVREATQEDLQAEEQGTLDLDRKAVILESIAEKLNDEVELNEVEQAFLEDNKEDIEAEQKRAIAEKLNDKTELTETEQALFENNKADIEAELKRIETFDVEVRGEPEVQGRIPLKRLKRLAANAKKAIAKNFEGANIIIHNDKASYQQAARENNLTGEGSAGFLGTDNKTVHIFAPLASETTIAHETFHVILRNSVDQAQIQELMGEFVTTLKKVIPADKPLAAKLDEFQKLYDAGQMNEEYVAEFFGELAAAYPTLDTKGKSVIARFVERLGKLLGVELKLSPDLTKRDQQILSLLERLAGQVSRGETVTARETGQLAELARSTSREQTEENLGAAEQKVSDFSMREIAGMSENGVVGHFTNEAFDKFLPKFMKTGVYGAGFYFTGSTIIGKQYGKGPNATIAFVDTNDMNLVDRDRVATPDELRTAANWLVDNDKVFITDAMEEGINPLDAAMMNLTSTPYDTISERRAKMRDTPTLGELHTNLQANFDEFLIEDDMGVITPVFMEVYPEYQGIVNRETEGGTIVDMVIWDFDAINQNIVKPTRQFAEAAAKGKVSVADFTEIVYEPTVTPEERMAEMEEELIRTKPETEAALRAAEQRVADFSDEQIQAMADEGVIFHFGPVDITRVIPEKLKRFGLGYGFYFTDYALEDSVFRSLGERVTMADSNELNLLDGDTAITEEQAKALRSAAKTELQEAEEYGDDLGFEESQVLMSIAETRAGEQWYAYFTSSLDDNRKVESELTDEQKATAARLVQEMLGFDGVTYGSDQRNTGVITSAWNFNKLNRAIIEPGQEPTRAAEQRVDVDAVRLRSRSGNRVSKGLATFNVDGVRNVEEIETLTRDYVREEAPEVYIKNANVLAKYPLVRGVKEFGDITTVEQADELYDIYTQQTLDNLRWMMETYPDEFSDISTLWYDGANKIANDMAAQFGVTPEQAAGILAALSPQKDWYQNVRLAELLLEAFEDNPVMTRDMVNYQRRFTKKKIEDKKKALKKARAKKGTSRAKAVVEKFNKDKARLLNDIAVAEALLEEIAALEGTEMLKAPAYMMPYYVRLHSETTKNPQYQLISPDGEMVGPALKDNGKPAKWAWGSYSEIGKAVSIKLRGGMANITLSLGQQHKVRNFFNNIIDPMSAEGDVTMDTHAIAVSLLKPLSTASAEVGHNFGDKAASSGAKGIKGTYYANQEAYQMLAEEMGLLPRQVQSVTWEAVRGLFTDKFKSNKDNVKAINQIWENYADGKITIDEARAQVLERAGGVNPPVWADSVQGELGRGVRESRERGAGRTGGRATEQRVSPDTEGPTIVYRSGAVDSKAEPRGMMSGGRSTGHFGTGAYFFSDRKRAEEYDDRDVTAVDIRDYNLAPASKELHDALREVNTTFRENFSGGFTQYPKDEFSEDDFFNVIMALGRYDEFYGEEQLDLDASDEVLLAQQRRNSEMRSRRTQLRADAKRMYNEPGNVDSRSTVVMKVLGYDGVYARPRSDMDNSTYGTVIYDVKPGAAEQRVAGPELAKVLQRYEFKSNNSLKNAELAPELRRNLKRFGYGVKQYGTRMDDFRVVSLDTGRAVDPNKLIEEGLAEGLAIAEQQREFEAEQRARELEERIIEIYNADERPYTGKDFEGRAAEQKVVVEAMAEPGTIADLVARGRELGLRDAAIRSVLLKRFGKDNADAIDTALTEYFDMFRAIPEAFGNVEGGIEVGRQIYDDVRRQLDEFARPKKPGRMTKQERTDRISELRAKFPEQKNLSDTELLRKHPRQAVAPSIAEVRAEALNLLRNNRSFNEQTTEVQEQLLVAFDKTLQTKANKQVNTLISQIRNNIRQRRKGAKNARTVQTQLRKLINEVIPRADYTKSDINRLNKLVAEVNEDNYFVKAEQVLKIVDKKREQIRQGVIKDIVKFVRGAAKTKRTPTGKVRPRSLDAPGQAYFREADRILRAILDKDQSLIMDIAANLANNPLVDVATQKMLNGEKLTTREQQLVDQKSALDMFADIKDKSLEEVEAILEDLKVDAGFSRANLKATRAARAERMNALREGAKAEVQDNWAGFATNEDGSAKSRNQLEAEKTQKKTIGDALKENGLRAKYDALVEWAKEGKRLTPAQIARTGKNITHVGALTGIMGEYFRENLYKRLGKLEERHLQGIFNTKKKLDEIAATIDGIENYKDITDLIFTSNPDGLMVNTEATGRRRLSTDEMMRIYALSKNPVQRAKLERMGFTDAVLNQIVDTVDNRLLEFVDKTVEYLANDYYESINDVYRKVNDINLGYIENYFPTRTQVKGDLSVKSKEETLSSTFFGPNAQVATALKERTDQKGDILMDQNVGFHGELGNHFNTMERFKAYAEGVQEMNAILSSDYTVALAGRLEADAMLNLLIAHGVTPDMFMSEMSFKSLDSLISKYTGASLAFKLMQIPKQATSFLGGFPQYQFGDKPNPIVDLIMFSFDYAVLLPQILLEGITLGKYKGPIASIAEDSATFRARLESNFSGDVYGLTAGVSGRPRKVSEKDYTLARKAATALRKGSGSATAFGDILGVLGYLPAYNRNRMRGMSQEEAVDKFNEYNETQQSRRPGERTPLQIRQNGLTRAFMAFTSSQILYLNNTLRHANNISKALRTGQKIKAADSRGLIFNAVMSSVLFTLASNIFILLYGNDEEKERAYRDTLASPLKNLFAIPVWGAAMEEFYNLYVGNKYPSDIAVNPLGKVTRDVIKVANGGEVSTAVKEVGELALGTNFDPGLSLINIAAGEPIEPELYDLIGVPKSARPE